MKFFHFQKNKLFFLSIALALLSSCANVVTPTGGPKDVAAPMVQKCEPVNSSTNFKSKSVRIYFDEFVALNEISNNVIISPPIKSIPDFKIKGKSVAFEIKDSLKENATYSINFGNSIVDITENNPIKNFSYVFSTGNFVDSLSYKGKIVNAQSLKAEKDIFVMLYKNDIDSLPLKEMPYYIAKTDLDGNFLFRNIATGKYKLFAIKDLNNNFIFDQLEEQIAFSDTLISPIFSDSVKLEIKIDSLKKGLDSLKKDSTVSLSNNESVFKLFAETDTSQKVVRTSILEKGKMMIVFKQSITNTQIESLTPEINLNDQIIEKCKTNDSLIFWMPKVEKDSIYLLIKVENKIIDTLSISLKAPQKREVKKEVAKPKLSIICSAKNGLNYDYFNPISFEFGHPLSKFEFEKVILVEEKDTLKSEVAFSDKIQRKLKIGNKLKEGKNYTLFIPPTTFTDIFGLTNDTLKVSFKTRLKKEYGTFKFKVTLPLGEENKNFILQLFNATDKLISEKYLNSSQTVFYDFLEQGSYKMKLIEDDNKNMKWDSGKYIKKLQP
ncbi:MAG: Ig-like domain-containing protein, partial [Bacteroidetes bacterium]|nr:Ig-like domain-containing protein [Bacteroidota bacterium]